MNADERIAVLEAKLDRNERDVTNLFDFIREHMEREEEDRVKFLGHFNELESKLDRQKSFIGGVIFAVTSLWAIITSIIYFFVKIKG